MSAKLLICTDLDRTLIPNGSQPESPHARQLFRQLVSNSQVTLAYVTGRDYLLVQEAIAQYQLPLPNFVIADVGSTIYEIKTDHQWLRIKDWDAKIGVSWHNKTYSDLSPLFSDLKSCRLQEIEKQGLHKLSYYVSLESKIETLIAEIKSRLDYQEIQSNLIWSIDEQANVGLLDILPLNANKRLAMEFLMEYQNFSLENTVFCGDSGNDFDVLISPIKSILVANADADLKAKVKLEVEKLGLTHSLYIAKGNYLNLNGNYSASIVEGIFYYFPEFES